MSEVANSHDLVLWGWLLLTSGGLGIAFFIYRLIWLERFRHPDNANAKPLMRIHGRVAGKPGTVVYCIGESGQQLIAQPFQVVGRNGRRWLVSPNGAVLAVRGYRHKSGRVRGLMAGDIVTIDGAATTLSNPSEGLYREAGRIQGVEAVRIAGGHWPELRWFRVPMAAAALVFLFSLGQILLAPGPTPLRAGLAHAFQDLPEASTVAGAGFSFSFRRSPPEPPRDLVADEGLGVLIGDQLLGEIHLVEDHLVTVQP